MINPPAILKAYLDGQPSLAVGSRIWENRLYPLEGYKPSDGDAICFKSRGGLGFNWNYAGVLYHDSFTFKCYSQDEAGADALYWRLLAVLNEAVGQGMHRAWAEQGSGSILQEPVKNWYFSLSHFSTVMLATFEPVP